MKTKQTFEPGKTITELWIDTTRKFEVIEWDVHFKKWDILELINDDDSSMPNFKNQNWIEHYIDLYKLSYADEDKEIKPWDLVWVSCISQKKADEDITSEVSVYYIWKSKRWQFVVEDEKWVTTTWKYISNKKPEETVEPLTNEEIKWLRELASPNIT